MILAAAAQPGRSWAGLIAMGVAYVLFRVGSYAYTKIKKPSPARALTGAKRMKVQATVGVDTDRTDRTDKHEWGAISHEGRRPIQRAAAPEEPRRSLLDRAKQIWNSGSADPEPEPDEPGDDVDVPLDDEEEQTEAAEEYIARCRDAHVPYVHVVRILMEHYGLTKDQAKYKIRKVDGARRGPAAE